MSIYSMAFSSTFMSYVGTIQELYCMVIDDFHINNYELITLYQC